MSYKQIFLIIIPQSTVIALEFKNKALSLGNNVYKTIDYKKLNELLKIGNWSELFNTNVNDCYDIFMDKIVNAINSVTILKKSNAKNNQLKEWMTFGLLRSLRRKNALSLKVKKHPNNVNLRSYYIKYRNIFTSFKNF